MKMSAIPRHVVVVPDGNRRWAKEQNKPSSFGHLEGAKNMDRIVYAALEHEISFFTIWLCSVGNITERGAVEVAFLYELFENYFKKLTKSPELVEKRIRVNVIGRWREFFPESLQTTITSLMDATKEHERHTLTFLMAYSGTDEMLGAITHIARSGASAEKITGELLKQNLWTKDLPAVDLVIRTVGEPHWSAGLMMWDVAEAQLYLTETFWPAFSTEEFGRALRTFAATERRYGA